MTNHNNEERKTIVIHSQKLAGYLIFNGCRPLKMEQSKKDAKLNVFVFYDNDKLQSILHDYSAKYAREKKTNDKQSKKVYSPDNRRSVQNMDE